MDSPHIDPPEPPEQAWDTEIAEGYDTPGEGPFAPAVLGPTVTRLAELAERRPVLELAIGTGRVAVPLLAAGTPVSGIELSEAMVAVLRRKVDAEALPVVIGDMATARAPGDFGLVYLVFNTIANLLSQDAQVRCFANAAAHLAPGGRFVVELWVPQLRQLPPGSEAATMVAEPGYLLVDTMDPVSQRLVSHHIRFDQGRTARITRTAHRWISPAELDLMARLAGFELESRHADFSGSAFTADSPCHVSVYRLPG